MSKQFDIDNSDVQGLHVEPLKPEDFDLKAYEEYESSLQPRCGAFWESDSGVAAYRRMRVTEVFLDGCRDKKQSLQWQLGALTKSMEFKADIPNFLEPWYGIGTIASCFGIDYRWQKGQAPAFAPKFKSVEDALNYLAVSAMDTPIGQYTLETIDYFLEKTQGRIPISLTDVQSPLNVACEIVDMNALFMEFFDNPENISLLLDRIAFLLSEFTHEQIKRVGDALVWPGHGFASSRFFEGFGMSDDNALMLSGEQYKSFAVPAMVKAACDFGGPVFHSCGNWSHLVSTVRQIPNLKMVDGAFGAQTDPSPNTPDTFPEAFSNTGIVLNARIVGDPQEVARQVSQLWKPGMKIIVVSYCKTPNEQQELYNIVHEMCQ